MPTSFYSRDKYLKKISTCYFSLQAGKQSQLNENKVTGLRRKHSAQFAFMKPSLNVDLPKINTEQKVFPNLDLFLNPAIL